MPRAKKSAPLDLSEPCDLTADAIERLACRPGRAQDFLRDTHGNGLRVRVTAAGAKSFVFEQKLDRRTIRWTIGSVQTWTIPEARVRARELAGKVDRNIDPLKEQREAEERRAADARRVAEEAAAEERRKAEQAEAEAREAERRALTVRSAWTRYVEEQRAVMTADGPKWSDRHYRDHMALAQAGGVPLKRRKDKVSKPGPLAELMALRLVDLTAEAVEEWAKKESAVRPARARLALRLLKTFLTWAAADRELASLVNATAASSATTAVVLGKPKRRDDCLQREQLSAWFTRVREIQNPVIAAYLQCLLLTGARREELASLRWEDVNFQWRGVEMRDKVEGTRQVPLTPYVAHLLSTLPRRNEWVFPSAREVSLDAKNRRRRGRYHARNGAEAPAGPVVVASASGRLVEPSIAHRRACAAAGLQGLTLHGLRRSFATLCEWLDIPGGVSAQIQGHAPQGVREQNYIRRPLDLLRVHHERIERWMLEQAGIDFVAPQAAPSASLRVVETARVA